MPQLKPLTYLIEVARIGSIRKAAEALAITPSALNRRILALEEELGAPIFERLQRAGARNVQTRDPETGKLDDLEGRMDLVFLDVPCSGTGVWRRRPDSKWRITANALSGRLREQREVLAQASRYVRPGGYLAYATCSLLPCENQTQVRAFLSDNPLFQAEPLVSRWEQVFGETATKPRFTEEGFATLSPARTNTDGFFVALLKRAD